MPSRTENPPIGVAEALEMVASEDSWLNDGLKAVVRAIKPSPANAAKRNWKCTLADTVGPQTITMTVWTAPRFVEGDLIEVTGQGIKRKEYNGQAEIGIGQKTVIQVLGRSVHHEEQVKRAEAGEPAINGGKQPVHGQTVGMAIKEAIALTRARMTEQGLQLHLDTVFWKAVHESASAIIRLSNALEHGNLTPSLTPPKQAPATPPPTGGRADPPPGNKKPPAGENGEAFPRGGRTVPDEDVPF